MKVSLPVLENLILSSDHHINDILIQVLIHLMARTEDSNVLGRHGMEALTYVQRESQKALSLGGYLTEEGRAYIGAMDKAFIAKNISPGGSADLLAVSMMIYMLKNGDRI
jgi:triphosphoribosyl-dephospho-CoA synthase